MEVIDIVTNFIHNGVENGTLSAPTAPSDLLGYFTAHGYVIVQKAHVEPVIELAWVASKGWSDDALVKRLRKAIR